MASVLDVPALQFADYSQGINALGRGIEQRFENQRKHALSNMIGGPLAEGDYAGAAKAAIGAGELGTGLKIHELNLEQKKLVAEKIGSYAAMAKTPEQWEGLRGRLTKLTGEDPGDFETGRPALIAEVATLPQILQQQAAEESAAMEREKFDYAKAKDASEPPKTIEGFDEQGRTITLKWDAEKRDYVPMGGAKVDPKEAADAAKSESDLRKEFTTLSKPFKEVSDSYGRVVASADNAAGHMALVFNFMKMLDPGSAVRETEFANAQNAAGVPTQIRNQWNKLRAGEILAPEQRQQFIDQAKSLYDQAKAQHKVVADQFTTIAQQYGHEPSRVVVDYGNPGDLVAGPAADNDPLGIR